MAEIASNLQAQRNRWSVAGAGERTNVQLYVIEPCDALLVERSRPISRASLKSESQCSHASDVWDTTRAMVAA